MDSFVFNKQSIPVFLRVEMLGETNDNRIMAEVKETGCVVFAKDEETFWNLTFDDLPYFSVMGDHQERLHGFLKRMIWIAVHFPKQW